MSLPSLKEVYWLASASWVFSIVSGLLSVHYAGNQQNVISRLHDEDEIKDWILDKENKYHEHFPIPSFSSVLIISSSKVLLNFALMTYIIGLGIYLGFVWQSNLGVNADQSDSRNIFIAFLICLIVCYEIYSISSITSGCKHDCWKAYFKRIHDTTEKKRGEGSPLRLESGIPPWNHTNPDPSGPDINTRGALYCNALQAASALNKEQIVKLLLKNGADVNAQGGYYGSALQAASALGNEQIVKLLLENGADVNARGGYYGNALQAASIVGYEQLVQLLLRNRADINA
jgi:hypothetical protein